MKMNKKIKLILLSCLLLTFVLIAASCSKDPSPYKGYNKDGYTVSVKFDANGGTFAASTEVIVDTYDISEYETVNGKKSIRLFAPEDPIRGKQQTYVAKKLGGYYLAGWYTERTEVTDANGNVSYTYGGRWDFANQRLEVDAEGSYDSKEPQITLYAAWVPAFTYEFYVFNADGTAELKNTVSVNPLEDKGLRYPGFNETTGQRGYQNDFPMLDFGKTYDKIYSDEAKTDMLHNVDPQSDDTVYETKLLEHSGNFNKETATLEDPVMKIYCDTVDGVWYEVDSAEQFVKNPSPSANYVLKCDLDFADVAWPENFTRGNFEGSIKGNGFSIKNVTIEQNNSSVVNFGMFGQLTGKALLENVTFDNVTVKILEGSRAQATSFGILAGSISADATVSNVILQNSKLEISQNDMKPYIDDVGSYGLVSGFGPLEGITSQDNAVTFAGDGSVEYEYTLDEEERFTLVIKPTE